MVKWRMFVALLLMLSLFPIFRWQFGPCGPMGFGDTQPRHQLVAAFQSDNASLEIASLKREIASLKAAAVDGRSSEQNRVAQTLGGDTAPIVPPYSASSALANVTAVSLQQRHLLMSRFASGSTQYLQREMMNVGKGQIVEIDPPVSAVVVCWAGPWSYTLWKGAFNAASGSMSRMSSCSHFLPKYGFETHLYYHGAPHGWQVPPAIKSSCPSCTIITQLPDLDHLVRSGRVDYVVLEAWTPSKFDTTQAPFDEWLHASPKLRFFLMFDGSPGDKYHCKEPVTEKFISWAKKHAQNIAGVAFQEPVGASRFHRLQLGIQTSIIPYAGETLVPRSAAHIWDNPARRRGGVILMGKPTSASRVADICAAALLTPGLRWFGSMKAVTDQCPDAVERQPWITGDGPTTRSEGSVAIVFAGSCGSGNKKAAGVPQSKLISLLQWGMRVVVEDGEPNSLLVHRLSAGVVIRSGASPQELAASCIRQAELASADDNNRIRLEAAKYFAVDEVAFQLAGFLRADGGW